MQGNFGLSTLESDLRPKKSPAEILEENRIKGAEFEIEYYNLVNTVFKKLELKYETQLDVTKYWRLDGVYGESEAIKILKSQDVERIRNCKYFWGYIENKNKEGRVDVKIARKQITINNMLLPYLSTVIQKNNGTDATHPRIYDLAGILVLDASQKSIKKVASDVESGVKSAKLLRDPETKEKIDPDFSYTRKNLKKARQIIAQEPNIFRKRDELVENISSKSYWEHNKKSKTANLNQPIIVNTASKVDSPTITENLGFALYFDSPVYLAHNSSVTLTDNVISLIDDAKKFLPLTNPKGKTIDNNDLSIIQLNPSRFSKPVEGINQLIDNYERKFGAERVPSVHNLATHEFGEISLPGAVLI